MRCWLFSARMHPIHVLDEDDALVLGGFLHQQPLQWGLRAPRPSWSANSFYGLPPSEAPKALHADVRVPQEPVVAFAAQAGGHGVAEADAVKHSASKRSASGRAPFQACTCCPTQGSCRKQANNRHTNTQHGHPTTKVHCNMKPWTMIAKDMLQTTHPLDTLVGWCPHLSILECVR